MRVLTSRTVEPLRATFGLRFRLATLFLGAGLLAAGCNRPAEEPPANILATSVSSTLTAQPVIPPTSTQPVDTPVGGGEIDPSTEAPTATLGDTESTPTEQVTEEAEVSPTPSNTPFPLEPGDPRSGLNLSGPDYADDFSQRFWYESSDPEGATFTGEDERLKITDHVTDGILWWTTTALEAESSYTQVVAQTTSCSGKDAYGIGLRVGGENFDRGYTLEISCDGAWRVRKFIAFEDEIPAILRDWTGSELIRIGPDASNTIGFLANGEQLFAFVNGQLLDTVAIEDSDYTSGVPSLFANASQTSNLTVYFDDFGLWYLPP